MKISSPILSFISRTIFLLLNTFALYLFLKGHNEPGGGFIAGIASAISFIFLSISDGQTAAYRAMRLPPLTVAAWGLVIAYTTSLAPLFFKLPFLYHKMIHIHLPLIGDTHIGTPTLFDFGVYLVVVGVTVKMILFFADTLEKESGSPS